MGRIIKNCSMKRVVKLALLFAFLIPLSSLAQNIQLTGTVTDTTGETVIGASVLEKGTTNGVITNIDGNFSLNVSPKAIIVISYVGYTTQEIPLNGAKNIKVVLREDTEMLEEVVVIGYGTMKKSDMTGAISFHITFLHGTITDDYYFFQHFSIFSQYYLNVFCTVKRNFLSSVSYVRNNDNCLRGNV